MAHGPKLEIGDFVRVHLLTAALGYRPHNLTRCRIDPHRPRPKIFPCPLGTPAKYTPLAAAHAKNASFQSS